MAFLLYGRSAAKLEENLANGLGERAIDRASAGAFVASTAKAFGNMGHVQFALAAQAYTIPPFRHLPEKRRHFNAADGKNVIHQSFAVFFDGATAFHLLLCHPDVSDVAFDI